ncbi:redoxin domain-containing protein [Pedobacter flavus]|uniref:Redoxin domain-containing protein n=1 Tax=Pedobacter flavus TaxID=3113906 RepID=A0ABU7H367_9SPHI|nr:redoxin domain-containing protein [Pedobacter sp. VNH31]MEE1885769.1 redoxin domain-containing protein [Pedobacter sp. VNH31]
MKKTFFLVYLVLPCITFAQGITLKVGDPFPSIPVYNIMNAPVQSIDLVNNRDKKLYVLNFWGTWCSPCIPEMDELAKLQKKNTDKVQIIGISDDSPQKLKTYLKNKPTTVWLATDTNYLFYNLFNLSSVSHSAILNAERKIVALVKTHSVTQSLIDTLLAGGKVYSDALLNEKPVNTSDDIFAVDTTLTNSFTIRGYMKGQQSMGRVYRGTSAYAGRRLSYVNTGLTTIFKSAYNIVSQKQVMYETDEKKINDYQNKQSLYCVDILVNAEEKDSLYTIFQKTLNASLPVKARIEYKIIPVYVLTNENFNLAPSSKPSTYGFSGNGYEGSGVRIEDFANDYLSNELDLPVVDETNLKDQYDIKTTMEMRTRDNVIKSIEALGLRIEKTERKMKMLVLYDSEK